MLRMDIVTDSIKREYVHPIFPCHLCKAQFFSSIERNDHLETHFTRQQCPSCNHILILVEAELFVISPHLPSRCLKQRVDAQANDGDEQESPNAKRRKSILSEPNIRVDGHTRCARKRNRISDRIREKHLARVEATIDDEENEGEEEEFEQNENVVIQVRSRPDAWIQNVVSADDIIIEVDESEDDDDSREIKGEEEIKHEDMCDEEELRDGLHSKETVPDEFASDGQITLEISAADCETDMQEIYLESEFSRPPDEVDPPENVPLKNDPLHDKGQARRRKIKKVSLEEKLRTECGERSKVICDICGEGMAKNRMLTHIRFMHLGLKTKSDRECDICGMICSSVGNLRAHRLRHTHPRPYTCTYCGRGFNGQFHLKEHLNLHTGERPHVCDVCGKCFARITTKTSHMRVHTGEKPFKCKVIGCDRVFRYNTDLRRHEYSVHGILYTKHVCRVCEQVFPERKLLKKHLLKHTEEKSNSISS